MPVRIFIAEDHDPDVTLIKEALGSVGVASDVERAADGRDALRRLLEFRSESKPDLIVLDLNLPIFHGFQLLEALRQNSALTDVPVAILTSSRLPDDEAKAARLGADAFISKPLDLDQFLRVVGVTLRRLLKDQKSGKARCSMRIGRRAIVPGKLPRGPALFHSKQLQRVKTDTPASHCRRS